MLAKFGIKRVLFVLETVCPTQIQMFSHHNFDRNLEQIAKFGFHKRLHFETGYIKMDTKSNLKDCQV